MYVYQLHLKLLHYLTLKLFDQTGHCVIHRCWAFFKANVWTYKHDAENWIARSDRLNLAHRLELPQLKCYTIRSERLHTAKEYVRFGCSLLKDDDILFGVRKYLQRVLLLREASGKARRRIFMDEFMQVLFDVVYILLIKLCT